MSLKPCPLQGGCPDSVIPLNPEIWGTWIAPAPRTGPFVICQAMWVGIAFPGTWVELPGQSSLR